MRPHLLLIDGDSSGAAAVLDSLREWSGGAFTVEVIQRGSDAIKRLSAPARSDAVAPVDLILVNLDLPDSTGVATFDQVHAVAFGIPIVVLCDPADELCGRVTVRRGAKTYLLSDRVDHNSLVRALNGAIARTVQSAVAPPRSDDAQARSDSVVDGIITTDLGGRINYLNAVTERLTGWSPDEAFGRPVEQIVRVVDAALGGPIPRGMPYALQADTEAGDNALLVRRDGTTIAIEESTCAVRNDAGLVTGSVIVVRAGMAARQQIDLLDFPADYDELTGLCKRTLLRVRIAKSISRAERNRQNLALLHIDIDRFKAVNDLIGHAGGDELLRTVAMDLRHVTRRSDTVSREHGDEFVVLLAETGCPIDAVCGAQKVLHAIMKPRSFAGREVCVTASIGVATWPESGTDAKVLLHCAEVAMYRAKAHGRNCYQIAPAPDDAPTIRLRIGPR